MLCDKLVTTLYLRRLSQSDYSFNNKVTINLVNKIVTSLYNLVFFIWVYRTQEIFGRGKAISEEKFGKEATVIAYAIILYIFCDSVKIG